MNKTHFEFLQKVGFVKKKKEYKAVSALMTVCHSLVSTKDTELNMNTAALEVLFPLHSRIAV